MEAKDEIVWMLEGFIDEPGPVQEPEFRPENIYATRERWVSASPIEWLEILLAISANPVEYGFDDKEASGDRWEIEVYKLLGLWIHRDPGYFRQCIQPYLLHPRARKVVIEGIGEAYLASGVDWLQPVVDAVHTLRDDEIVSLIDALGDIGRNRDREEDVRQQLEHIQKVIPTDHKDVHYELDLCLKEKQ
jgi:hypothetical protein